MKNNNKKILVSILTGAMLLTSATAASAASVLGSRSSSMTGTGMTETYVAKTNALSYSDLTGGIVTADDLFSKRDLKQEADLSEASYITVEDSQIISITAEGVYVLTGEAANCTVRVEADKEAKIQLVLDGVSITNDDFPAIYVVSTDKVFVTTTEGSENTLSVTGDYVADGSTNTDAVIWSKEDIVLNGKGTLTVTSAKGNGITSKDDLKITGGTINVTTALDALEANDSIVIYDGNITVSSKKDGLHTENDEDDSLGYIWIGGGTLNITASDDDAVHGTSFVQVDGGTITVSGAEGIEGTYIQINDGTINVTGTDDGINGANKSSAYETAIEIAGGTLNVTVGQGDTDAIDSNGNIYITGGTVNITASGSFDYDGTATYTSGTIIVNGQTVNSITNSMMGGGMQMGGWH